MILKTYRWSFVVTAVGLVLAALYGLSAHLGIFQAIALVLILSVLEISLSFDNAVVNATILERMSDFWRKIFLSVGIIIAVFGMRLIFPIVLVSVTAGLGPIEVVQLALKGGNPEDPGTYGYELNQAHPTIAAFGGMFLLMLVPELHLRGEGAPLARAGRARPGEGRQARVRPGRRRGHRAPRRGRDLRDRPRPHGPRVRPRRRRHLPPGQRPR